MVNAYEKIIITNLEGGHPLSKALVFQIPPTIHEHNVVVELLKRLRHDWPGAWYCAETWARNNFPGPLHSTTSPKIDAALQAEAAVVKMKEVTREHMGLPPDDKLDDLPV